MNVTFRLGTEDLEKRFVAAATAAGLDGLKGHRVVGGMRASIYNAFPEEGVRATTPLTARSALVKTPTKRVFRWAHEDRRLISACLANSAVHSRWPRT